MALASIQNYKNTRRVERAPEHTFQLATRPFVIQPFMIAPVLPGETMKNLLLQARVVTDPILNPLVGWWKEYYFFYVKHRDLDARDLLTEMMLDPEADLSSLNEATNAKYYHFGGTIPWAKLCLKRVVEEYFRNEGEAWDAFALDGMPIASAGSEKYLQSAMNAADFEQVDIDTDLDNDGTLTTSELEKAMRQWHLLKAHNLTEMSYEDYLATYGVSVAKPEHHIPELIRYVREWTYPTNTINPADGAAASACSWAIADRADKARYFSEPGFILGVTVTRPKVYLRALDGAAVGLLKDAYSWLPAIMADDPGTSIRGYADGHGPLSANTDTGGFYVDVKDIFLYGDQFLNFAPGAATGKNLVDLPTPALQRRYIDSDDANSMFVSAGSNTVREDGIVSLKIAGRITDTTPGAPAT